MREEDKKIKENNLLQVIVRIRMYTRLMLGKMIPTKIETTLKIKELISNMRKAITEVNP